MAAGVAAATLLSTYGWKGVMIVGGILPLCAALLLLFTLPEAIGYVVTHRPAAETRALLTRIDPEKMSRTPEGSFVMGNAGASASAVELFRAGRALGTIVLWLAVIFNLVVNYAMQNWMTTLLVQLGQSQATAIGAATLLNAGGVLSGFFVGPLMDRFGPYRVMTALFVACAGFIFLVGLTLTAPAILLLASSFWAGFCSNGLQKAAGALCVFFYPSTLRSTGVGWTFGVGRVGAILGPLAVGAMLALNRAPGEMFDIACIPMLLGAAAVAIMSWYYRGGRSRLAPLATAASGQTVTTAAVPGS